MSEYQVSPSYAWGVFMLTVAVIAFIIAVALFLFLRAGSRGRWILALSAFVGIPIFLILAVFMARVTPRQVRIHHVRGIPAPVRPYVVRQDGDSIVWDQGSERVEASRSLAHIERPVPELDERLLPHRSGTGSAWWPETAEIHHAAFYPSPEEAARALARDIIPLLPGKETEEGVSAIRIVGSAIPQENRHQIVEEVAQAIRQQTDDRTVAVVDGDEAPDQAGVPIALGMRIDDRRPARWARPGGRGSGRDREQLTGQLEADIRLPGGSQRVMTRFVDKPWVSSFSEFTSAHGGRDFILGQSHSLTSYLEMARQQAMWSAAHQMAPHILNHATQMARGRFTPVLSEIADNLVRSMNEGRYVVDEFPQEFQTNAGGQVYRYAVLLEFTPQDARAAATQSVAHLRSARFRRNSTIASFFGLIILTCGVYAFLNMATRGYYREVLLCASVAVVVIGGVVFLMVMT